MSANSDAVKDWLRTLEDASEASDWELYNMLRGEGVKKQTSDPDDHRWYTCYDIVVELQGRFVSLTDWTHKSEEQGDTDVFCDGPPWDSVRFVKPTEKTVTVYE